LARKPANWGYQQQQKGTRERGEDKGAERRRERQPSAKNGTRDTNIGIAHQGVSTG